MKTWKGKMSKKTPKEHICVVILRDGHCYGASEPMTKSEALETIIEAKENDVEAYGIDLNVFFDPQYGDLDFETNFIFDEDSRSYVIHFSNERSE